MKTDWTVKEIVEPKSKKIHRFYSYKGKPCKRIVLDSPIAKQLAGYVLIEKDLRSTLVWLEEIERIRGSDALLDARGNRRSLDRDRYNLVKGLFVAALTFYGKAFSQCEGRRVKLEKRQLAADFYEIHEQVIELRNNFAAHSGATRVETAEVALVLPPKKKKHIPPNIFREMNQPDYFMSKEGDNSFVALTQHARKIPLGKIEELQEKILKEEVLPKGYDFWNNK